MRPREITADAESYSIFRGNTATPARRLLNTA
jgi:hypothetical protein